jgi:hypothetical protein
MFMEPGAASGQDDGLGKALIFVAVPVRMHQFTNFGTVFGCVRSAVFMAAA